MLASMRRVIGLAALALASASWAATAYDFGNPGPDEEWMRQCVHRARLDPEAEADRLGIVNAHADDVPDGAYDVGEGLDILTGVPNQRLYWSRYQGPRGPLAWNGALNAAAYNHADDMYFHNHWSHYTGPNSRHGYVQGDAPWDRAWKEGYPNHYAGENLAKNNGVGDPTAADTHAALYIDEGVSGRGHRTNMLHHRWREIGVGYVTGPAIGGWTDYWAIDFASDAFYADAADPWPVTDTVYLTGVVFDDTGDGLYQPGEQIAGACVWVWQDGGAQLAHYAVTADGGGYSVPLLDAAGDDLLEGQAVRAIVFDPVEEKYLEAIRTLEAGEVIWEETSGDPPDSDPLRLNIGLDVTGAQMIPAIDGDADFNGKVELADLSVLAFHWEMAPDATWLDGNFDNDGDVDLADLSALAFNWGAGAADGAAPEPAGVLLLIAGAATLRRRRRA